MNRSLALLAAAAATLTTYALPRALAPAVPDASWTKGWWMARHEQKLAEIRKNGGAPVVFIGDSITHFWEDGSRGGQVWKKYFAGAPFRALNLGFSGDRTEHALWRIAHGELDGYRAKAIVLMLGTNNTGHFPIEQEPPEATVVGLYEVVRRIRAKQPQAKLLLCAIFPCDREPNGQRRLRNDVVNKELAKLADGRNVFWLDFTRQMLTADGTLPGEIAPDALHPGPYGYELWASAIIPYLHRALAENPDATLPWPSLYAPFAKASSWAPHTVPAHPVSRFGYGESWWNQGRPEQILAQIADNKNVRVDKDGTTNKWFDVVMVGDSITHRWYRGGCGGDETWAMLTNRYSVLNLGYGADRTEHALWRMRYGELYGYKAGVFSVMIGTNNGGAGGTDAGIAAVVREIRKLHPESHVIVQAIFPRNAAPTDRARVRNAAISASVRNILGTKDPMISFVDFGPLFLEKDGTLTKEMMPDLLHPHAKAYRIWYDALVPEFRKILGK